MDYSMKKKLLTLLVLLPVLALFLAGCATGLTASAWPGITTGDQVAYVAGGPHLYAVNTQTGAELWRYPEKASTAYPFFATPVLTQEGQLIFGGFDHKLYNLNPETRNDNWIFTEARDRYIAGVLVVGDLVYAPNSDYHLYAVSLTSGKLLWSFNADQSLWSTPATDGTNIYFGSIGGMFYALNAQSGSLVWETDMGNAVLGSPVGLRSGKR
jgi:outer membrane protein assembly factor BamB